MWGRRGILKARGCSNDGSICRLFMAHCSLGNSAGRLRRGVLVVRTGPLDPPPVPRGAWTRRRLGELPLEKVRGSSCFKRGLLLAGREGARR